VKQVLTRLRRFLRTLPGVTETVTFGHPTWRAGKKTFAVYEQYRGEWAIAFKASRARQKELVLDPRFYVTPYVGRQGWTSLRVPDARVRWTEARGLLLEAWHLVAPEKDS
jgi:predicted DNA-binding protein (MmcQ/YjbR family)